MLLRLCAVAVLVQICSSFSIKAIERRSLLSSRYSEVQTKKEIGYLENRCLWSTSSPLDAPVSVSSPEKVSTSSYPILVLCCAIAAVCALDRVVMSIAILPMGVEYTYSDSTKGAIAAFFSLGYMVGLVPSGIASATTSPKKVLAVGLAIWSAAQFLTPAAASLGLPALYATRAVMGAGEAACIPSLQVVAANFVPSTQRSTFWGLVTASLSLGTISAYTISPPLMDAYEWPSVFQVYGAVGLALTGLWWQIGADTPVKGVVVECEPSLESCELLIFDKEEEEDEGDDEGERGGGGGGGGALKEVAEEPSTTTVSYTDLPWVEILRSKPMWALASAHAASNVFLYFSLSWLPTYFNYQFGLSTNAAAGASTLPFAASAIGSLLAGTGADALVANGVNLTSTRKIMQSIAFGGPILGLLVLNFFGNSVDFTTAEAMFIFMSGCHSFSSAGFGCCAQDISRRFASLLYGGTSAVAVIAGASGQFATGAVLEANGRDFSPLFTYTAGIQLVGLACWLLWWNSDRVFE